MSFDQLQIGSIVIFDMGDFPNIGMITDIYMVDGVRKCLIMQPNGRPRERSLDYDYRQKFLRPLLGEWNLAIKSKKWDEWIMAGKPSLRNDV